MRHGLSLSSRLALAIVALVVATAGTVGYLSYRNIVAVATPRTLVRLNANAAAVAADLANIIRSARADFQGSRNIIGMREIIALSRDPSIDLAGGQTLAQWRARVAGRLVAEMDTKSNYAQFRLIGIADGGREIIRVERPESGAPPRIVPDAELQRRGDSDYFKQAVAAQDGTILISPIELNKESGTIATPPMPTIRLSAPIFAADGTRFGVLIANLDLGAAFKSIEDATNPDATLYVVNDHGDYLTHPEHRREFGFEFGTPFRIQDDFPALAQAVTTGKWQPVITENREGKRFGVAFAAMRLANGAPLAIVETVPEDKIVSVALSALRDSSLIGGSIAVLGAILLAIALARTMTRPLSQMTKAVANFSKDAPLVLPLTASGEIGVLAREFEKMAREVNEKSAAIRHEKEVFESIMATMAEAVLLVGMDGSVMYENAAATAILTSPLSAERPAWNDAFEAFYPDGITPLPPEQWPSRRSLRGETVNEVEIRFRARGSDKLKHLLCGARPIRNAAGAQTGSVVVFRDVTDAKEIERQLHQSQKLDAIGQLTGGIAHDFNNMLTVITGTAETLVEELSNRPDLAGIAGIIGQAADRGAELTRHLLAFARKQTLQPRNIDVNDAVLDAVKLLRPTLGEHIEIESKLEEDVDPAHIDPSQLSAALLNLAVNARDAMTNGGKLLLETGNVVLDESYAQNNAEVRPGPYVMIAVSDTGTGIPTGIRDKVFEPFFTTKEVGKGTGLGLSMVYGFVKQSNGHIKIYSEEGYGTTIKLYLPRASAIIASSAPAAAVQRGSETILVVEDDALVRDFVVTQLHSLGYKTLTAGGGTDALAQIDGGASFDLLFTDVIMPGGMNGRQLADTVASRRPVRVLYTSGYTENAIVHHGRLDAGVLLLAKPYRRSELARMVRAALDAEPRVAPSASADMPNKAIG